MISELRGAANALDRLAGQREADIAPPAGGENVARLLRRTADAAAPHVWPPVGPTILRVVAQAVEGAQLDAVTLRMLAAELRAAADKAEAVARVEEGRTLGMEYLAQHDETTRPRREGGR